MSVNSLLRTSRLFGKFLFGCLCHTNNIDWERQVRLSGCTAITQKTVTSLYTGSFLQSSEEVSSHDRDRQNDKTGILLIW